MSLHLDPPLYQTKATLKRPGKVLYASTIPSNIEIGVIFEVLLTCGVMD